MKFINFTVNCLQHTEFAVNDYYVGQKFKGSLGEVVASAWRHTTSLHNAQQAKKHPEKEVILTVTKVRNLLKNINICLTCFLFKPVVIF